MDPRIILLLVSIILLLFMFKNGNGIKGTAGINYIPEDAKPIQSPVEVALDIAKQQQEQPAPAPGAFTLLNPHFFKSEFACDCDGYCDGYPVEMDMEFISRLQKLRENCGAPIIVTSGIRCPRRNAEVGGVPQSLHMQGRAADVYSPGFPLEELNNLAKEAGLRTIVYHRDGFLHCE